MDIDCFTSSTAQVKMALEAKVQMIHSRNGSTRGLRDRSRDIVEWMEEEYTGDGYDGISKEDFPSLLKSVASQCRNERDVYSTLMDARLYARRQLEKDV